MGLIDVGFWNFTRIVNGYENGAIHIFDKGIKTLAMQMIVFMPCPIYLFFNNININESNTTQYPL